MSYPAKKTVDHQTDDDFWIVYEFETESHSYTITFEGKRVDPLRGGRFEVEIQYTADGFDFGELTDEGSPFHIVGTVIQATREVENKYRSVIDHYILEGALKETEDPMEIETTQRARIYQHYFQRAFPSGLVEMKSKNVYVYL